MNKKKLHGLVKVVPCAQLQPPTKPTTGAVLQFCYLYRSVKKTLLKIRSSLSGWSGRGERISGDRTRIKAQRNGLEKSPRCLRAFFPAATCSFNFSGTIVALFSACRDFRNGQAPSIGDAFYFGKEGGVQSVEFK